jgi:hypothetical protein
VQQAPERNEKYHTKNSDEAQLEKKYTGKRTNSGRQDVPKTIIVVQPAILH